MGALSAASDQSDASTKECQDQSSSLSHRSVPMPAPNPGRADGLPGLLANPRRASRRIMKLSPLQLSFYQVMELSVAYRSEHDPDKPEPDTICHGMETYLHMDRDQSHESEKNSCWHVALEFPASGRGQFPLQFRRGIARRILLCERNTDGTRCRNSRGSKRHIDPLRHCPRPDPHDLRERTVGSPHASHHVVHRLSDHA